MIDVSSDEPTSPLADHDLLERFVASRDEAAFAEIVRRHGRLVMSVCLRVLRDRHDAEDGFQATFLVLARRARRIRRRTSLPSWLYGVAYRLAIDVARRRQHREKTLTTEPMCEDDLFSRLQDRFDQHAVDEELNRLPEKYRDPLVLYYLAGQTSREIAEGLGTTQGTVDGRLRRGRAELRIRLARRGVVLTGVLASVGLSIEQAAASVGPALIHTTVQAGLGAVGGTVGLAASSAGSPATFLSRQALQIARKEIIRMTLLKPVMATTIAVAAICCGAAALNLQAGTEGAGQGGLGIGGVDTRASGDVPAEVVPEVAANQERPRQPPAGGGAPAAGGGSGASRPGTGGTAGRGVGGLLGGGGDEGGLAGGLGLGAGGGGAAGLGGGLSDGAGGGFGDGGGLSGMGGGMSPGMGLGAAPTAAAAVSVDRSSGIPRLPPDDAG